VWHRPRLHFPRTKLHRQACGFRRRAGGFDDPEILVAEINLAKARYHHWTDLANPFADRRTDLFDRTLEYRHPPTSELAFRSPAAEEPGFGSDFVAA
jgi:hypothetical protein